MISLLLVEDDSSIAESLAIRLKVSGFATTVARTLSEARKFLKKAEFSLVVLDVQLPDGNGFELLRELRRDHELLPVVMLTAQGDPLFATKGLLEGAADYVRKPFSADELLARLDKVLNRQVEQAKILNAGKLTIHLQARRVLYKDVSITLTKREFEILTILAKSMGGTVSRTEIMDKIDQEGAMSDKSLDSHVFNLRKKISDATGGAVSIISEYGVGFILKAA